MSSKIKDQKNKMLAAAEAAGGADKIITPDDPDMLYRHSARELFKQRFAKPKFLIPDVIPQGSVLVFVGEDGIGKTQICTQLCLSIAYKRDEFLGLPLNITHGSALVCATEDAKEKFTSAMVKQIHYFNPSQTEDDPNFPDLDFVEAADFEDWNHMDRVLVKYFSSKKYDLVVIDAMLDLFNYLPKGNSNDNNDATKILAKMQSYCNQFGVTIIVIHHASKSAIKARHLNGEMLIHKNDQLGAGRITSKPRTVLGLSNHKDSTTEDGLHYINYFHVLKANLMKRTYEKQVLKLKYLTNDLIHIFDSFVSSEEINGEQTPPITKEITTGGQVKNKPAKLLSYDQHLILTGSVFEITKCYAKIDDLAPPLSSVYQVGDRAIRADYIPYLKDIGMIVKEQDGYYFKKSENVNAALIMQNKMPVPPISFDATSTDDIPF